jgi:predicted DNA-binding protein (MmcQ/YjbR family)
MNKKSWLSIILDDSQDDKEILSLIAKSYSLTERK